MTDLIRIEFWNGQLDKKGNLVKTKHNPCLFTNVGVEEKPWRASYKEALEVISKWNAQSLTTTDFLHHLRFVAYGLGKRDFNDTLVVWWGNMTTKHKPQLSVDYENEQYTIYFNYDDTQNEWICYKRLGAEFYWTL